MSKANSKSKTRLLGMELNTTRLKHKKNERVRSSYAYAYVAGVLTC